jgi:hypothetical protein
MIKSFIFEDEESFNKFLEMHKRGTGRIVITFSCYPNVVVDIKEQDKKEDSHLISVLGSGMLRRLK